MQTETQGTQVLVVIYLVGFGRLLILSSEHCPISILRRFATGNMNKTIILKSELLPLQSVLVDFIKQSPAPQQHHLKQSRASVV